MMNEILNSVETLQVVTGTETTLEQAAKMCKAYADKYTEGEFAPSVISRQQIEEILSQPGVTGIAVANGLDEFGAKAQILLGVDEEGRCTTTDFKVTVEGSLKQEPGKILNVYSTGPQWWEK